MAVVSSGISVTAKPDPTKNAEFQKVVQIFLNTPHQPQKPTSKKAKSSGWQTLAENLIGQPIDLAA